MAFEMNQWDIKQEDSYNDDDSIDADGDDELNNDAEGVWSPDIEQSFQEALAIYPPCGRRKIILSEEGKMYGRNELIARYIKLRTGKTRTRKQVSSHIQVLAKRKTKDLGPNGKEIIGKQGGGGQSGQPHLTSAQIISPLNTNKAFLNQMPTNPTPLRSQSGHLTGLTQSQVQCGVGVGGGYSNNVLNSQNLIGNNSTNAQNIWPHPGLQADNTTKAIVAAVATSAALGAIYAPQNNFPSEALAVALGAAQNLTNNHLNTSNSQNTSPSQSPPPSQSQPQPSAIGSSSHLNLTQSHLWSTHTPKTIGSPNKLQLIEFSGFLEQRREHDFYQKHLFVHLNPELHTGEEFECINVKEFADKFPDNDLLSDKRISYLVKFWVDLNYTIQGGVNPMYAVTNIFESMEPLTISCSTKVCSFGTQVVEKVEVEHSRFENGRYVYRMENSPMCEYMITFIDKLKQLPEKNLKNSVLENFSILQLIKNHDTKELLLSLAYLFEVSTSEHGAQHVIYRLTNK